MPCKRELISRSLK
uniref:Uncharacterized protein n=1 Tax=Arundo donax TaxID=35708 RepID=A0A0A8ZN10_ARUDO